MTAAKEAPPLTFATETAPSEATIRAIQSGLTAHETGLGFESRSVTALDRRPRRRQSRSGRNRFVLVFEWLFVDWLWVAAPYRKQGIGSQLMVGAEAAARAQGCRGAYLDTFTFQAPKFYERLGYQEFGRLDDFPPGHARIWFTKALG